MSNLLHFNYMLFKALLRDKFTNIRAKLADKFINLAIWATCSLFVTGYLLQAFGLARNYGAFQLGGVIASVGLFELYGNAVTIVSDIEGDRTISYYLSLPASAPTILLSYVCYYATISSCMSLFLLPLGKLLLGSQLILANISWPGFIFFAIFTNLVCATATLLVSALIPSMDKFDILWMRFIFPLWFLGGFQFSWASVYQSAPWFSYIMLINPVTYISEGGRAVLLGQEGNLNFWLCCFVLLILWVIVSIFAYKTLKRRLDFV